jgi:hypothetical protein
MIMPKANKHSDIKGKKIKDMLKNFSQSSSDEGLWSQTDSDYFGSSSSEGDKFSVAPRIFDFEPLFLEDSKIGQSYVINLTSYRMSMNPYINSNKMKEELDRYWRRKYPDITEIMLSKIREQKYEI